MAQMSGMKFAGTEFALIFAHQFKKRLKEVYKSYADY
jgi:hypothetical protein